SSALRPDRNLETLDYRVEAKVESLVAREPSRLHHTGEGRFDLANPRLPGVQLERTRDESVNSGEDQRPLLTFETTPTPNGQNALGQARRLLWRSVAATLQRHAGMSRQCPIRVTLKLADPLFPAPLFRSGHTHRSQHVIDDQVMERILARHIVVEGHDRSAQ